MTNIILKKIIVSALFLFLFYSCSTYGDIQRLYENTNREELWEAMQEVVILEFSDIESVSNNPPKIVSTIKKVDQEFGLDKTERKAFLELTGFNRPYFVQVKVKVFPNGFSSDDYSYDYKYAEKILNLIDKKIKDNKSKNIFEKFIPL